MSAGELPIFNFQLPIENLQEAKSAIGNRQLKILLCVLRVLCVEVFPNSSGNS